LSIINKLFEALPDYWNKDPKSSEFVDIISSDCKYQFLTITDGYLYLHYGIFVENSYQETVAINLTEHTMSSLLMQLDAYGLIIHTLYTTEDLTSILAVTLAEVKNANTTGVIKLNRYTSKNWKVLYPIAILLKQAKDDIKLALQQIVLSTASGSWLDYWASFFNITREYGEVDAEFARRLYLSNNNPKVNNIAMEEYIRYLTGESVLVKDVEALQMEVEAQLHLLDSYDYRQKLHLLINNIKGYGIAFYLNFIEQYLDVYKEYYLATYGVEFKNSDTHSSQTTSNHNEVDYLWRPADGFIAGASEVNIGKVSSFENRMSEGYTFELSGNYADTVKLQNNVNLAFTANESAVNTAEVYNAPVPELYYAEFQSTITETMKSPIETHGMEFQRDAVDIYAYDESLCFIAGTSEVNTGEAGGHSAYLLMDLGFTTEVWREMEEAVLLQAKDDEAILTEVTSNFEDQVSSPTEAQYYNELEFTNTNESFRYSDLTAFTAGESLVNEADAGGVEVRVLEVNMVSEVEQSTFDQVFIQGNEAPFTAGISVVNSSETAYCPIPDLFNSEITVNYLDSMSKPKEHFSSEVDRYVADNYLYTNAGFIAGESLVNIGYAGGSCRLLESCQVLIFRYNNGNIVQKQEFVF
jgi:hypothetical protein